MEKKNVPNHQPAPMEVPMNHDDFSIAGHIFGLKNLTKPTADRHGHGGSDRSGDRCISKSASTSLLLANDPIILTKAPPNKSGRTHTKLRFPIFLS